MWWLFNRLSEEVPKDVELNEESDVWTKDTPKATLKTDSCS